MLLIFVLFGFYAFFNVLMLFFWLKIPFFSKNLIPNNINEKNIKISVLISVRNESKNIITLLNFLKNQILDKKAFEVIIVDDFSEDDTVSKIQNFCHQQDAENNSENNAENTDFLQLKLLFQKEKHIKSPKKHALMLAMQEAKGEIIVQTDGDCVVGEKWLAEILAFFEEKNAVLVSSSVVFFGEKNLFEQIQTLEFATLIGVGAVTLSQKKATMANGANLAYKKQVFEEVGGYANNLHIASGDDEFLLQKIAKKYPNQVFFLKNKNPQVKTFPQQTIYDFLQQRRRWASKWRFYEDFTPKILAIFVFLVNFCTIFLMGKVIFDFFFQNNFPKNNFPKYEIWLLLLRWGSEFLFLSKLLFDLKRPNLIWFIPLTQIFYPFYVVLVGILAQKKGFEWKGRKLF